MISAHDANKLLFFHLHESINVYFENEKDTLLVMKVHYHFIAFIGNILILLHLVLE